MGLGDSITEGADFFTCYLYPLWEKLFTAGYQFDFIGPRESKCRIGTLNHCGFSGKNVEFLESKIDSLYRLYPADIVLLHAGHNHFAEEKVPAFSLLSKREVVIFMLFLGFAQHLLIRLLRYLRCLSFVLSSIRMENRWKVHRNIRFIKRAKHLRT